MVDLVTADRRRLVQAMLTEEYRLPHAVRSPYLAALSTLTAFLICGLVPLLPYLFRFQHSLEFSVAMTGMVLVTIGSVKSMWSTTSSWRSGLTTVMVGVIAAAHAYAAEVLAKNLLTQEAQAQNHESETIEPEMLKVKILSAVSGQLFVTRVDIKQTIC